MASFSTIFIHCDPSELVTHMKTKLQGSISALLTALRDLSNDSSAEPVFCLDGTLYRGILNLSSQSEEDYDGVLDMISDRIIFMQEFCDLADDLLQDQFSPYAWSESSVCDIARTVALSATANGNTAKNRVLALYQALTAAVDNVNDGTQSDDFHVDYSVYAGSGAALLADSIISGASAMLNALPTFPAIVAGAYMTYWTFVGNVVRSTLKGIGWLISKAAALVKTLIGYGAVIEKGSNSNDSYLDVPLLRNKQFSIPYDVAVDLYRDFNVKIGDVLSIVYTGCKYVVRVASYESDGSITCIGNLYIKILGDPGFAGYRGACPYSDKDSDQNVKYFFYGGVEFYPEDIPAEVDVATYLDEKVLQHISLSTPDFTSYNSVVRTLLYSLWISGLGDTSTGNLLGFFNLIDGWSLKQLQSTRQEYLFGINVSDLWKNVYSNLFDGVVTPETVLNIFQNNTLSSVIPDCSIYITFDQPTLSSSGYSLKTTVQVYQAAISAMTGVLVVAAAVTLTIVGLKIYSSLRTLAVANASERLSLLQNLSMTTDKQQRAAIISRVKSIDRTSKALNVVGVGADMSGSAYADTDSALLHTILDKIG